MTKRAGVLILSCLLAARIAVAASSVQPDLASMDWSAKAPHSLATNPPPDDVVKAFMSDKIHHFAGYPLGICYARFADLRRSGTLSLVVSEGDGRFCHLSVVDKIAGGFEDYGFDLGHYEEGPEIKDLGGDGNLELVAPADLTGYYGALHCMAEWPVIYAWTGSTYSDVSSRYRSYYEQQLASLKKEIAQTEAQNERAEKALAAQGAGPKAETGGEALRWWHPQASAQGKGANAGKGSQPVAEEHLGGLTVEVPAPEGPPPQPLAPPEPDRAGLDCAKAEAAKMERFLGISRDAGMGDAIKWANSNNPVDREFAADVLADIGTPEAIEYLHTLSRDTNSEVAMTAKLELKQVSHGPVKHTVDLESIPDGAGKPSQ